MTNSLLTVTGSGFLAEVVKANQACLWSCLG